MRGANERPPHGRGGGEGGCDVKEEAKKEKTSSQKGKEEKNRIQNQGERIEGQ